MSEITSPELDDDHWATSGGVRDHLDVPTKGSQTDYESWIVSATDTVQAWWANDTGQDYPEDLPDTDNSDPNQLEQNHPLLVRATALLAASEAHESKTQDARTEEDQDGKHVLLESRAKSKFSDWLVLHGYTGSEDPDEGHPTGSTGATGSTGSLIDLG